MITRMWRERVEVLCANLAIVGRVREIAEL